MRSYRIEYSDNRVSDEGSSIVYNRKYTSHENCQILV